MELQGDQMAVSATDEHVDGKRVYIVWMLADSDEPAFEARLPADSPGHAVDQFAQLLGERRLRTMRDGFSWKGPARGKLRAVK